jgi:sporulation protein YlmC with PRC-barrel domain
MSSLHAIPEEEHVARGLVIAASSAILATTILAVHAQTSATRETRPEIAGVVAGGVIGPDQIRASKLLGSAVYNTRDVKIGQIKELILDKNGVVTAVIVDIAFIGFVDKYIAVNLSDLTRNNNRVTLDRTSDQLQQMTSYKLENASVGAQISSPSSAGRLITIPPQ